MSVTCFPGAEAPGGNSCLASASVSNMQSMILQQGVYQLLVITNTAPRMIFNDIVAIGVTLQ